MRIALYLLLATNLIGCTGEAQVTTPTVEALGEATYSGIYDLPLQLDSGRYEGEPFQPGASSRPTVTLLADPLAFGDLDGDGVDEAVVVLVESSGGSGSFVYLAVVTARGGKAFSLATTLVGDRVPVLGLEVLDGLLAVRYQESRLAGADAGRERRRDWRLREHGLMEVKIAFDLETIDDDGLIGSGDGKRALSYEFCVPDDPELLADVAAIDPSAQPQGTARGRIGCSTDEVLFIGETHQPRHREILESLASRPYIARIEQAFFE